MAHRPDRRERGLANERRDGFGRYGHQPGTGQWLVDNTTLTGETAVASRPRRSVPERDAARPLLGREAGPRCRAAGGKARQRRWIFSALVKGGRRDGRTSGPDRAHPPQQSNCAYCLPPAQGVVTVPHISASVGAGEGPVVDGLGL